MKKLFMILPIALILCFMVGCQDKAAMAELEEFKAQAALEEQNIELIRNTNETWMRKDYETIRELCAPNFAYYSSNSKPLNIDEVIEHVKTFLKTFPVPCIINLSFPRISIFPEGEEFFKTYHLS